MKKILVPTDFSAGAANALDYAVALALAEKASIVLLHAYPPTFTAPDLGGTILTDKLQLVGREATAALKELCIKLNEGPKVSCSYMCRNENTVPAILQAAEELKAWLVVMGTAGEGKKTAFTIGSVTSAVISDCSCPVIAVPESARFNGIRSITYATDYHVSDLPALEQVSLIAKPFGAKLRLLHISDGEFSREGEREIQDDFLEKVRTHLKGEEISFRTISGSDVEKKLEEYAAVSAPDLIALSTRHRSLLYSIFGKSITREMARHTNVPLLVFHYKQEPVVFI